MIDTKTAIIGIMSGVVIIGGLMMGLPTYSVWQQEMSGKAELAKAEQNRQIKIQEAKALKEAATYQAEAEVARAKGVAEANKIIGQSLKGNEAYLRYLWVNALNDKESVATVYIPTEANMPLMKPVK
jgi:regulator of protease activity HflC (stomatin/prohibitin superfamily)